MENIFQERRRFKRLNVNFTLTYQVDKPLYLRMTIGWGKEIDALMLDLSEEGMAITTSYNIPVTTLLSIQFTLINSDEADDQKRVRKMNIVGEVKSNLLLADNDYRLGIHFIQIDAQDRMAIADFVKIAFGKR